MVKSVCDYAVVFICIQTTNLFFIIYGSCLCMMCSVFCVKGDCLYRTEDTLNVCIQKIKP